MLDEERRSHSVTARFNDEEFWTMQDIAEREGETLSDIVRRLCALGIKDLEMTKLVIEIRKDYEKSASERHDRVAIAHKNFADEITKSGLTLRTIDLNDTNT